MPLLLAGSIQYYSRAAPGIEVKKLSITMSEEDYCTTTDPRSLYYVESEDPTTEEYGDKYRFEYYKVKDDVAELRAAELRAEELRAAELRDEELRAGQLATHVPTKAIPPKAPPNTIRPFFDDDHYMPPPELLFGAAAGSTMLSRRTNPQQEAARLRLRDALLDAQQEAQGLRRQVQAPESLPRAQAIAFPKHLAIPPTVQDRQQTIPLSFTNRPRALQIPVNALGDNLDWAAENYALMVGGDATLFKRFLSQGRYPANAVAQDYVAQEVAPYKVEPTMTPMGYSTTRLSSTNARSLHYFRWAIR